MEKPRRGFPGPTRTLVASRSRVRTCEPLDAFASLCTSRRKVGDRQRLILFPLGLC